MAATEPPFRLIDLCERLAEATRAGNAEWRVEGEDTYVWERPEGSVAIGARDRDGLPPYDLSVFNPARELLEELSSALIDEDQPAPWNEPLAELYRAARRSALGADQIIQTLIAALPASGEGRDGPDAGTATAIESFRPGGSRERAAERRHGRRNDDDDDRRAQE